MLVRCKTRAALHALAFRPLRRFVALGSFVPSLQVFDLAGLTLVVYMHKRVAALAHPVEHLFRK